MLTIAFLLLLKFSANQLPTVGARGSPIDPKALIELLLTDIFLKIDFNNLIMLPASIIHSLLKIELDLTRFFY